MKLNFKNLVLSKHRGLMLACRNVNKKSYFAVINTPYFFLFKKVNNFGVTWEHNWSDNGYRMVCDPEPKIHKKFKIKTIS